jgi:transcriptional regulator with PAS, ATPase and Fis domain
MDTTRALACMAEERRRVERDLAVGEWVRARRRVGNLLGELIEAVEPGDGEARSWLRILGCLAELPGGAALTSQLGLWPELRPGGTADAPAPSPGPRARGAAAARMGVITRDRRMLAALALLDDLAGTDLPVLLEGESGTGKEVVARGVHRQSRYGQAAFVAVNCGALPGELHESELFGHARGAYTGAALEKPGLFEAAHGGSIFLDEIAEMDPRAQVKLLRVLETGELRRLGEVRTRQVRVRVIAATNACVDEALAEGRFRRDLLHRLAAIRVVLPPLRERTGDILPLASHFLRRALPWAPALTPGAQLALLRHAWPGNVRELKYTIERAAALWARNGRAELSEEFLFPDGERGRLHAGRASGASPQPPRASEDPEEAAHTRLPGPGTLRNGRGAEGAGSAEPGGEPAAASPWRAGAERSEIEAARWPVEVPQGHTIDTLLAAIERQLIERALDLAGGNRTVAARLLGGLSRTTLIGKMKRLGLFPPLPAQGRPE